MQDNSDYQSPQIRNKILPLRHKYTRHKAKALTSKLYWIFTTALEKLKFYY